MAGPVALISMWDWSPSNQTGTADFIEGLSDASQAAGAQVMDSTVPYLDLIQMFSPTQQYPNVTHYCISHIIATEDLPKVSDILTAGYANVTSPLSIILVDPAKEGLKSNEDTAYGWRGYASVYVWVSMLAHFLVRHCCLCPIHVGMHRLLMDPGLTILNRVQQPACSPACNGMMLQ